LNSKIQIMYEREEGCANRTGLNRRTFIVMGGSTRKMMEHDRKYLQLRCRLLQLCDHRLCRFVQELSHPQASHEMRDHVNIMPCTLNIIELLSRMSHTVPPTRGVYSRWAWRMLPSKLRLHVCRLPMTSDDMTLSMHCCLCISKL